MSRAADERRAPKAFLLDGPSGAGKTTLALRLASRRADVDFVRRFTTRPRRSDSDDLEYQFVDHDEFKFMAETGEFIEFRSFDFGMSYGLPLAPVMTALERGRHVLGLINLGNIERAREMCSSCIGILIDAPIDILNARLLARAIHSESQISERITNAAMVLELRDAYDYVVANERSVSEAAAKLECIVNGYPL